MLRTWLLLGALLWPLLTPAANPPQTLTPLEERSPALDFTLRDIKGKTWRLSELRGRPVIVNFWATWSPPCRAEMPSLQRAWQQLQAEGVMILAINAGESADTVSRVTRELAVDFPLLLDPDSAVLEQWPAKGLPAAFIIDPEGRIAYRATGGREWDDPLLLAPILKLRR